MTSFESKRRKADAGIVLIHANVHQNLNTIKSISQQYSSNIRFIPVKIYQKEYGIVSWMDGRPLKIMEQVLQ